MATRKRPGADLAMRPAAEVNYGRRTVSMPNEVLSEVDSRVGARQFSAYVTDAVRRQLERDKLRDLLADYGPISDKARAAADARIAAQFADLATPTE